jgi:hypothetical protein
MISKVENKMGATASRPPSTSSRTAASVTMPSWQGRRWHAPRSLGPRDRRIGIGTQGLGLMQVALERAIAYGKERVQFAARS